MNLKNQPPIFVPREYRAEIERLSKAALMDIAWDYATRCATPSAGDVVTNTDIAKELRTSSEIVQMHRKQAKAA